MADHIKFTDDKEMFDLGVILYIRSSHNKTVYKKGDGWWLVDQADIIKDLEKPTTEKVSGRCVLYSFKGLNELEIYAFCILFLLHQSKDVFMYYKFMDYKFLDYGLTRTIPEYITSHI